MLLKRLFASGGGDLGAVCITTAIQRRRIEAMRGVIRIAIVLRMGTSHGVSSKD